MDTFVAATSGKGTGAIATIEVCGADAGAIVGRVFKPSSGADDAFEIGRIYVGTISDGAKTIDQVTVGCEGEKEFAIHCHGNVLIVEMIMELLEKHGARVVTAEALLAKRPARNTIEVEARLALTEARTLDGAKTIVNQIEGGLSEQLVQRQLGIVEEDVDQIRKQAGAILDRSRTARLLIEGCTVVLAGPPNSGKSTLFNSLCGKAKAIVTDMKGTTRDWVSARCRMGRLSVELIDTAGLDTAVAKGDIDSESQARAVNMLEKADVVLLVLDASEAAEATDYDFAGKKVVTVLNKSDLPVKLDASGFDDVVSISAQEGTGLENIVERITEISGVDGFELTSPVCFAQRQRELLEELAEIDSAGRCGAVIAELLNGTLAL